MNCFQNIIWGQLPFIFASFIAGFLLIFSLELSQTKNGKKIWSLFLLLPPTILSTLTLGGYIIKSAAVANGSVINTFGVLYPTFIIYIIIYILSALGVLIYKYLYNKGTERLRIKYVFLGILAFVIPTIMTNMLLPTFFDFWLLNGVGPAFSLFMILAITYAIVRYHLMDIWVILRLGAIFTLLLTAITFIYIFASYLLIDFLKIGQPWNYIISSLIVTVSFSPIKNLLELLTDKVFFKKRYKFSEVASQIESSIHEAGLDLDKTLEIINQVITEALKVTHSAILILIPKDHFISRQIIGQNLENLKLRQDNPIINYLNIDKSAILDKEELEREAYNKNAPDISLNQVIKELGKNDFSLVVPIELKEKLIGVYLLGPKKSQDSFSEEDFRLLRHVAWEMSFAIDNAKSYEELKKLDEAKSNFISIVSHQLRTPVTVSRCNLEVCFDAGISPKEKDEAIRAAYDGVGALSRQLDQLITVLEIEERRTIIKKTPIKIDSLIDYVVSNNKINLTNKNIKLDIKINPDVPEIYCDEGKIKKVVDVLLANAISYVFAEGQVEISVYKQSFNKKDKMVFAISDNGVGIQEESKGEMFKKFFRGPEAISMSPNGFGLGLFIAKKIIDSHGGEIWFESKDRGVTFYFSLPLK